MNAITPVIDSSAAPCPHCADDGHPCPVCRPPARTTARDLSAPEIAERVSILARDRAAAARRGDIQTARRLSREGHELIGYALGRGIALPTLRPAPEAAQAVLSVPYEIVYDRPTRDYAVVVAGETIGYAKNYHTGEETARAHILQLIEDGAIGDVDLHMTPEEAAEIKGIAA